MRSVPTHRTDNQKAAVVLYAAVNLLMSAAWVPVFRHLRRHPELLDDPDEQGMVAAQRSRPWVGVASYAVAGILGYAVTPVFAIVVFVWMIVYHAITSDGLEANRVARLLAPPAFRRGRSTEPPSASGGHRGPR